MKSEKRKTKKRWRRIFAFGEDSHTLRLTSKLVELRAANADQRACGAWQNPELATPATDRKSHPKRVAVRGSRIFAFGEDSHTLRLTSKLVELRAANADQRARGAWQNPELPLPRTEKATQKGWLSVAGVAGFGPTNEGVKVPCLTAWLYPYENLLCYFSTKKRICQYLNRKKQG